MCDIKNCPRCGSDFIGVFEETILGIPIKCRVKCFSCNHTVEKPNKRAAYKTWEKEREEVVITNSK